MEGGVSRIAVVTEGNKGLGFEMCRQLASKGLTVVLTARDEKRAREAVKKMEGHGLSNILSHQLEITDAPSIARLVDFLRARFGKLDILVNHDAACSVEYLHVSVEVLESYKAAKAGLQTKYYGTKHVTEALLPLLHASPDGRIVNVSSGWQLLRLFSNEQLKLELNGLTSMDKEAEQRVDELRSNVMENFGEADPCLWPNVFWVHEATMNAFTKILSRRHSNLRVNYVYPGCSRVISPEESAGNVTKVALLPADGPTGVYFALGEEKTFM